MIQERKKDDSDNGGGMFVSMKNLQYEFLRHKVGVTKGGERRDTRRELLLKMGAEPEKKKKMNYKMLLEAKRAEKQELMEQKKLVRLIKYIIRIFI